jgi:hypothetical protein
VGRVGGGSAWVGGHGMKQTFADGWVDPAGFHKLGGVPWKRTSTSGHLTWPAGGEKGKPLEVKKPVASARGRVFCNDNMNIANLVGCMGRHWLAGGDHDDDELTHY